VALAKLPSGQCEALLLVGASGFSYEEAAANPNIYPPYRGAPVAQQPWEWYASVGPVRRGTQCVVDVDVNRGYGFMKDCPAPQASAAPRQSRVAHRYHHKVVQR
jgi:hypothetical protein